MFRLIRGQQRSAPYCLISTRPVIRGQWVEFSCVQRRVREPVVLLASLAVVVLEALIALLVILVVLLWQLPPECRVAGALSNTVGSLDRLNRLQVRVLLILAVTSTTPATSSAMTSATSATTPTTPATTPAVTSATTPATPTRQSSNVRANQNDSHSM